MSLLRQGKAQALTIYPALLYLFLSLLGAVALAAILAWQSFATLKLPPNTYLQRLHDMLL